MDVVAMLVEDQEVEDVVAVVVVAEAVEAEVLLAEAVVVDEDAINTSIVFIELCLFFCLNGYCFD
jgi:hypothetical protein